MNKPIKFELPSLLSFERKLETSDALMYSGIWADVDAEKKENMRNTWQKVSISTRYNRSTQSAYGTKPENKSQPNPVSSGADDANLPIEHDTLKVIFTLRVIGNLGRPFACNDVNFERKIKEKVDEFKLAHGFFGLAFRYAYNIANGRFLWSNRVCAENVRIEVFLTKDGKNSLPLRFNAYDFSLNNFEKNSDNSDLKKLAGEIQNGLENADNFTGMTIIAYVKLGDGQHVWPSQEMNMGEKKKVLFKLNDCAAMHSVKIGNALRTIDTWYEDNAKFPIAAEPFGAVTQRNQAYRATKNDLYTLILDWVNDKALSEEAKNYILANFIRGGVFSGESKEKKKEKKTIQEEV